MSLITRTFTFTDGTTAYGSQVDSEIANIVNTLNNLDAGTTKWDNLSVLNSSTVPLIVDNSTGSQDVADFKVNGVAKVSISGTGLLTGTNGAVISGSTLNMSSQKIVSLANGTASTDAVALGQIFYGFQAAVFNTDVQTTSTTSATLGLTTLAGTITPTSASHRIKISVTGTARSNTGGNYAHISIDRAIGGVHNNLALTTNSFGSSKSDTTNTDTTVSIFYVDSPASTSACTYTVSIASGNGTNTVSWNVLTKMCTILLEEIV